MSSPLKRKHEESNESNEVAGKMMIKEDCKQSTQDSSGSASTQDSSGSASTQDSSGSASTQASSGSTSTQASSGSASPQASSGSTSTQASSGSASPQVLRNGNVQDGFVPPHVPEPLPQQRINQQQNHGAEVFLNKGHEFDQLMHSFSENRNPTKITYLDKRGNNQYFLTEAYDKFWSTLYKSELTKGYRTLLLADNLQDDVVLTIARILRRGWEDEHYFPKKIAQPFLEACIFNRENINNVHASKDILYDYLDPRATQVLESRHNVDQESLEVIRGCCNNIKDIEIGDKMNSTCKIVVRRIMVQNIPENTKKIWTRELAGLLDLEEFKYLMKYRNIAPHFADVSEHDMEDYITPHKIWHTFFYGWDEEQINYYESLLINDVFPHKCRHCGETGILGKHVITCQHATSTMHVERHDCVLRKLYRELKLAIERRNSSYFSTGDDWKVIVHWRNIQYEWPEDLSMLNKLKTKRYPHLIAYSTSPKKQILIIEPAISWEYWISTRIDQKTEGLEELVSLLEASSFHVTFLPVVLGSRGVFSPDLFLLLESFGMTRANISRTMEEISKSILMTPYMDYTATAWNKGY